MEACQLLCASNATYDIVEAGTLPLTNPYVHKAGFTQPPVTFVGGDGVPKVNACLVGTAGNAVIVAFRGTLTSYTGNIADDWSTFLDWIQNFLAAPVNVPGLPGKIHGGFQKTFFTLWPAASIEIQKQTAALGPARSFLRPDTARGARSRVTRPGRLRNRRSTWPPPAPRSPPRARRSGIRQCLRAEQTDHRYPLRISRRLGPANAPLLDLGRRPEGDFPVSPIGSATS